MFCFDLCKYCGGKCSGKKQRYSIFLAWLLRIILSSSHPLVLRPSRSLEPSELYRILGPRPPKTLQVPASSSKGLAIRPEGCLLPFLAHFVVLSVVVIKENIRSMIIRGRSALPAAKIQHAATRIPLAAVTSYGRTAAYRRSVSCLASLNYHTLQQYSKTSTLDPLLSSWQTIRISTSSPPASLFQAPLFLRLLHSSRLQHQQESPKSAGRDSAPEPSKDTSESEQQASGSQAGQSTEDEGRKKEDSSDSGSKSEDGSKKQEAPPPPPHGSKSAWQVFTDTLSSEFKASKEWNESTKALASSAHQFTESDSVKRARAAYSAASGAATSRTSEAIKSTGKAIGSGAAWTWQTPVVKGIRGGVNATGRGIERATRPVRDTKAFQSIKETVDDGSSSRYGGWVEKEERKKQKELRELQQGRMVGKRAEQMEEDPK